MQPQTHPKISRSLCGEPAELSPGKASVVLTASEDMAADERGLVHGGFVFGMADYAAMLAVNQPNVVLAKAEVKFLAPTVVGEAMRAEAQVVSEDGNRASVEVEVRRGDTAVFRGTFLCVTPSQHVLDRAR